MPIWRITKPCERSSTVRRMRSPVSDLFADLADALHAAGVEWFLFGAQAAILHGAARLTADVDVTVRLPDAMSNDALVAVLRSHGFTPRFHDPGFIERSRVIPLVHTRTSIPVDMALAGPGIEDRFFARVQIRDVDGVPVRLASPEDLIVMKTLAGRAKDVDDVLAMIGAQGNGLDVRYIRETLRLLEGALSQSDLLPAFEQALGRARGRDDRHR